MEVMYAKLRFLSFTGKTDGSLNIMPNLKQINIRWENILRFQVSKRCCFIRHCNRNHAIFSKRGRLDRFTTYFSKRDLDKLLNTALQAPSLGGGCVIPITVPYWFAHCAHAINLSLRVLLAWNKVTDHYQLIVSWFEQITIKYSPF